MEIKEALSIIEQACSEFIGKRIDHIKIEQAIAKVKADLDEFQALLLKKTP